MSFDKMNLNVSFLLLCLIFVNKSKQTQKPSPPNNVRFLFLNETDIRIEWTAAQKADNNKNNTFLISLANDSQKILDYNEIECGKQEISKNISSLTPGNAYILVILNSIINDQAIIVSDPVYSRFRTRPNPPANLREVQNSLSSYYFDVKWEPPKNPSEFHGFEITYQFKGQNFTKFIDKRDQRSCRISDSIFPGLTYKIKLNSVTFDAVQGQKYTSRPIYREITTRPLTVINLKSKIFSKTELFVEWMANPKSSQDSYYISYNDLDTNIHYLHITNHTHILLSNLSYGHNYSISVAAISNHIQSNYTFIHQIIQVKSSKLIPILIGLLIISALSIIITGIYFHKLKKNKTQTANDEQAQSLFTMEPVHPQASNIYTTVIYSVPQIDPKIRIIREDLEIGNEIGRGQFGTVYSGQIPITVFNSQQRMDVAIKTSTQERDMTSFLKEALIMKNFKHKNVLALIGVSLEGDGSPLVVLPLMENGDLLKYVRNDVNQPTVKQLINFAIDVANGMDYLSTQHFIHRDLAARNCMLDKELTVKIADFGLSRHLKTNNVYTSTNLNQLLPIRWMSIESIERNVYDTKTDVWSYGVLVWEVLTRGVNPYSELNNCEICSHLKAGHRLPQPQYCPNEIYNTLKRCWNVDPGQRPTFAELSSNLQDIIERSERKLQQKRVDINEANIYYNFTHSSI